MVRTTPGPVVSGVPERLTATVLQLVAADESDSEQAVPRLERSAAAQRALFHLKDLQPVEVDEGAPVDEALATVLGD